MQRDGSEGQTRSKSHSLVQSSRNKPGWIRRWTVWGRRKTNDLVPAVAGEHQPDQDAYDAINEISVTIEPIHRKPRQSGWKIVRSSWRRARRGLTRTRSATPKAF